jgi:hypothetical protein
MIHELVILRPIWDMRFTHALGGQRRSGL